MTDDAASTHRRIGVQGRAKRGHALSVTRVATKIQVLGSGCSRCINLAANTETALQELGLQVEIDKVTAIEEIAAYHVFATPALVIDGSVKSAGRIPKPGEIAAWLLAAAKQGTAA